MLSAIESLGLNSISQLTSANRGVLWDEESFGSVFQTALQNAQNAAKSTQPLVDTVLGSADSQSNLTVTGADVFSGQGMIGSIFQNAVQNVRDTDADLVQAQYLLATGQLDNPATATIAATKNELAVDLLVQLRSRALEAYSTLTQITL